MAYLEDKLDSLFRRVRRLQQSAFAVIGDTLFESMVDSLKVLEFFQTSLFAPFVDLLESFTMETYVSLKFGGRHLFDIFSTVPKLRIWYDALRDALASAGVLLTVYLLDESITLSDSLLPVVFYSGAIEEIIIKLQPLIRYIETLTLDKLLSIVLPMPEPITIVLTEITVASFPQSTSISEALIPFLMYLEVLSVSKNLLLVPAIPESITIGATETVPFVFHGSTAIDDLLYYFLYFPLIDTLQIAPNLMIVPLLSETLDLEDALNYTSTILAGDVSIIDTLSYFLFGPLYEYLTSTGNLVLALPLPEDIDLSDYFNLMEVDLYGAIAIVDTLLFYWKGAIYDTFTSSPYLEIVSIVSEVLDLSDYLNIMGIRLDNSLEIVDTLSMWVRSFIDLQDSFTSDVFLMLGGLREENLWLDDSLEYFGTLMNGDNSIADSLSFFIGGAFQEVFVSAGNLICGTFGSDSINLSSISQTQATVFGDVSIAEALDYVLEWTIFKISISPLDSDAQIM